MKTEIKSQIVKLLLSGNFVSGEDIGRELNISRTAVAAHIKQIGALGLDIYSVRGKGYKLANKFSFIDKTKIQQPSHLQHKIENHFILSSTNDVLMEKIRQGSAIDGEIVLSECQTSGRGRRGRTWQSPIGSHIYFSQYFSLEDGLIAASGLSLAVGLAVAKTCQKFTKKQIELKWPNDIYSESQKLAGILVEAEGQSEGKCHLVVGIGINFNMPEQMANLIDQPWTDLSLISHQKTDRNVIVSELIAQLNLIIEEYRAHRLKRLYKEWNEKDAFKGKLVQVVSANQSQIGVCKGIDESGALILFNKEKNSETKVFGGEISLRAAQ